MQGHSLRVGRYAAGMAEALGMNATEVGEIRAAGFLHDIGKVTVDKRLFTKAGALEPGPGGSVNVRKFERPPEP